MSCRRALFFPLFCFVISAVLGGCSRREANRIERLALLPFENLTPDPQLDWMTQAISGTLALQLATAPDLNATSVAALRDVHGIAATRAFSGYFTLTGGRLRLAGELRDVARQKTIKAVTAEGEASGGILPLIDRLAVELYANAQPTRHRNESATRDYWLAMTSEDANRRGELLRRAMAADPGFAAAHLALVQLAIASSDAQALANALAEGRRNVPAFTPFERARFELLEARARQDTGASVRALGELTRLAPANDDAWRSLGELELSRRNVDAAAKALERSLQCDPVSVPALNSLAYTKAHLGDLEGARRVLAKYSEVAPGDANAHDTGGDVHFHLGRFAEAEKYYLEAHRLNPALLAGGDLYKAALAARFAGDLKRADAHFANWLAIRKAGGDPLLAIREAVWEASTGRLSQARTRLRQFIDTPALHADLRTAAASQLALFDKVAGERASAPAVPGNASAAIAAFLCQPDAGPAAWRERAATIPGGVRGTLLGYALLLNGHFKEAVPVWRAVYATTHPSADSDASVMLAWAVSGSGQAAQATPLLARAPIPGRAAEPGLTFLTWMKYTELARR